MSTPYRSDPLLTPREVAEQLSVSVKTVRRFVERGELPALRVGHQVRVDPVELQAWLRSPESAGDCSTHPDEGRSS